MNPSHSHTGNITGQKYIIDQLYDVVRFWFPNTDYQDIWFSHSHDSLIRQKFSSLVDTLSKLSLIELSQIIESTNTNTQSNMKKITYIGIVVCLDQYIRNIYRNQDRSTYSKTDNLCIELINHYESLIPIDSFDINQRIFLLLPFRHQRTTHYLDFVMSKIKIMNDKYYEKLINRFTLATLKDYTKVTDTIIHYQYISQSNNLSNPNTPLSNILYCDILDHVCIQNYPNDIIKKYDITLSNNIIYKTTLDFIKKHNITSVCISLSGGVDSMMLSYILSHLRSENEISDLCAVHLNYNNRSESDREAEFIKYWCEYLQIPFITRKIEHMKRGTFINPNGLSLIDRSFYETETKNIRFNLYRYAMTHYNTNSVMLGHHADDLTENVLMNVFRGNDILDLFTMSEHQIIENVPISRPMLPLVKDEIYNAAHTYCIPYFKDTTPNDCYRGVIRRIILPAVEKLDPMVKSKINTIGDSSRKWKNITHTAVFSPILSSIISGKYGFAIPISKINNISDLVFWQKILSESFHTRGTKMISHKNMLSFIAWSKSNNKNCLRLSNGYMSTYHDNHIAFVNISPSHLQNIHTQNIHSYNTTFVNKDKKLVSTISQWEITISTKDNERQNPNMTIYEFINGELSYSYELSNLSKSNQTQQLYIFFTNDNIAVIEDTKTSIDIPYDYSYGSSNLKRSNISIMPKIIKRNIITRKKYFTNNPFSKYIPQIHIDNGMNDHNDMNDHHDKNMYLVIKYRYIK